MSSWKEKDELLRRIHEDAKNHTQSVDDLLASFYSLYADKDFFLEYNRILASTFDEITKDLPEDRFRKEVSKLVEVQKKNEVPASFVLGSFGLQSSRKTTIYFDCLVKEKKAEASKNQKEEDGFYNRHNFLPEFLSLARTETQYKHMMQEVENLPEEMKEKTKAEFYSNLGDFYQKNVALRPVLWDLIANRKPDKLSTLYSNVNAVVETATRDGDGAKEKECLQLIIRNIVNPNHTLEDLRAAYKVLGQIHRNVQLREVADATIREALKLSANDNNSRRIAYNQMEAFEKLKSHIAIGQRTEKTGKNPHGFRHVDAVPYDKPAVLFFGGTGTNDDKSANGYLSNIEKFLGPKKGQKSVGLYAIIHDFGYEVNPEYGFDGLSLGTNEKYEFDPDPARYKLFKDYGVPAGKVRPKLMSEDTKNPQYIDELFNRAFLSRICDEDGKRLPSDDACKRVRNLTVCAHCHGAYTFMKIEEKMQEKMKEVGYSKEECAKIQKELLCLSYAPDVPLGVSKSTMISFLSSNDSRLSYKNNFAQIVKGHSVDPIEPSYFPQKKGEFFMVKDVYTYDDTDDPNDPDTEHRFFREKDKDNLTKDGQILATFFSNAIKNSVQSSIDGTPLPSVEDLVCGQDERCHADFKQMKENGVRLWDKIRQVAILMGKDRHQQKRESLPNLGKGSER